MKKSVLLLLILFIFIGGLYAQVHTAHETTDWKNFYSINAGIGTNFLLVDGFSIGFSIEPKYALTPEYMVGIKGGLHFSSERYGNNIVVLETQGFFRWNFLQLDNPLKTSSLPLDVFAQGGIGFIGAFRGSDVRDTRASLLFDITAGITIPIGPLWHIEPSISGGYPFYGGISITAGRRFYPPQRVREIPSADNTRREVITRAEYIIFAPNSFRYNDGIDRDAESLNDLAIIQTARILRENPDLQVRIEGHANPVTNLPGETGLLLSLSTNRANQIAAQLRARGVPENQIIVIAHGGTRTIANDRVHWNMNRRVELIIVQTNGN